MANTRWLDLGSADQFRKSPLTQVEVGGKPVVIVFADGAFSALAGSCLHSGAPLATGTLAEGKIVCPWHGWRYDCRSGEVERGGARLANYAVKVEGGRLWIDPAPTQAAVAAKEKHPLHRPPVREAGPIRVVGISTTAMNHDEPRYSTSEKLLNVALDHARESLGAETRLIKLNDLRFRNCEGYYSKSAESCVWPCTITQADPKDQMERVYEALVFWADVVIVATPIRWGAASSLYFKMAERMNCIQNQITVADTVLIRNKVASFIITGGQDNIQGVAGQMMTFFTELGFYLPQFPFIAHSRGWSAEDMEKNIDYVEKSRDLSEGARQLAARSVEMARLLNDNAAVKGRTARPGRKATPLAPPKAAK
jgi:nitrite reductase/ring-hydroxylating ferredoxin subunit/multimeric flavodoxin WrbA